MGQSHSLPVSRRRFLKGTTAAGVSAVSLFKPHQVFGSQANSTVQVGIIGTGGRGVYDGENLVKTGKARIVALADYFDFQLEAPGARFGVDPSRRFAGLEGYKEVLALEEVDAVVLTTPPFFRPAQFEAAVAAGKHVFAEKPIAVDAAGCRRFLAAGEKAGKSRLTVVAGLQSRYDSGRGKFAAMIADGAIGKPLVGHSQRMGQDLWRRERLPGFSDLDFQVRNWLYFLWASGDFITEMHIHNLDIFNWFTGLLPLSATGRGGRDVRTDIGDIYDHITVLFEYPEGFHLSHTGTQIDTGYTGSESRIIGSLGSYDATAGLVARDGSKMEPGEGNNASEEEMQQFVRSILEEGEYLNNSVYVTTSTFTTILGREAAYRNARLSWDELWKSDQSLSMP